MKQNSSMRTYQTRIHIDEAADQTLHHFAQVFAQVQHTLLAHISKGKAAHELKTGFLQKFHITARQFNACRVEVEGKIASIQERRVGLIAETKQRIQSIRKKISSLAKHKKDPQLLHQKKRRLHTLEKRLEQLEIDHKEKKASLCFGSKKLFHAQFHLEKNGYANHKEWQDEWRQKRASEIFFLGSKDEASGNQSCTATLEDQTFTLRIRLPDALQQGKYLFIRNVHFAYGQEQLLAALQNNQAISWRLKYDAKGWRLFASTAVILPKVLSQPRLGVIGLDINPDHLAVVETDRFGNPIDTKTIPLSLYGKNKHQAKAIIAQAAVTAIACAEKSQKPLIVEELDFQKKKTELREKYSPSQSRLLSSFAYSSLLSHLQARAGRQGIQIAYVNPAYTSIIGRVKFSERYGLTIHQAAALTIGRRFLGGSEKLPHSLGKIPDGKGGHVALSLPVRNRDKHVWTHWRQLSKELVTAHVARFRMAKANPRAP